MESRIWNSIVCALISVSVVTINADEWSKFVSDATEAISNYSSYVIPTTNGEYFSSEDRNVTEDFGTFDFIIVGGGTAGGVLANRLTEENVTILVVEAGKEPPAWTAILGLSTYFYKSEWSWGYNATSHNYSCLGSRNQSCFFPRGKALGGCSAINAGLYVRGNKEDYDNWEKLGNQGWSYQDCLPYFKKSEKAEFNESIDKDFHGFGGPQRVNTIKETPGLTSAIIDAMVEMGYPEGDMNGYNQTRSSKLQFYLDKNRRAGSYEAFIQPARNRTNLNITLESLATKILMSNLTATGVEFIKNGQKYSAKASKEVIVSAGVINTPQLLMLSGIGPKSELERHGIELLSELPVGENLQDHIHFPGVFFRANSTFYNVTIEESLELWRDNDRPLTGPFNIQGVTFLNYEGSKEQPEVEVVPMISSPSMSQFFLYNDDYTESFQSINALSDIMFCHVLLHPYSKGRVTLQSNNPRVFPLIDPNYLADERDVEILYKASQDIFRMNATKSFQNFGMEPLFIPLPGCDGTFEKLSKDWWVCAIRHLSVSLWHPMGTTRMGLDPKTSVVNSNLTVHGVDRLRVVDAGVMPLHVSGHLNPATVMIAEKAADIIKATHGLESN